MKDPDRAVPHILFGGEIPAGRRGRGRHAGPFAWRRMPVPDPSRRVPQTISPERPDCQIGRSSIGRRRFLQADCAGVRGWQPCSRPGSNPRRTAIIWWALNLPLGVLGLPPVAIYSGQVDVSWMIARASRRSKVRATRLVSLSSWSSSTLDTLASGDGISTR